MRYKVELVRIMRYPNDNEGKSYDFDDLEKAIEYYIKLISINLCSARETIIKLYDGRDVIGVWNSEV